MENDNIIHFSSNIEEFEDSTGTISDPYFLETALSIERRLPVAEAEDDADNIVQPLLSVFAQSTMAMHYLEHLKSSRMSRANREAADHLHVKAHMQQTSALKIFSFYMLRASGSVDPEAIEDIPELQDIRAEAKALDREKIDFLVELESFLAHIGSSIEKLETVFRRATSNPAHIGILMTEIACMYEDMRLLANALHDGVTVAEADEDYSYYDLLLMRQGEYDLKLTMEDVMAAIFAGAILTTLDEVSNEVLENYCAQVYELINDGQELMEQFNEDDEDEED